MAATRTWALGEFRYWPRFAVIASLLSGISSLGWPLFGRAIAEITWAISSASTRVISGY
jgi:hypothetical protein